MKTQKFVLPLIVVLAIAGAVLFALFRIGGTTASKPKSVTIATFSKALGNTPYHVAKHFRWFEDSPELQGVQISYKEYNDRPTISAAFSSDELHVLFSADIPSIICRAQGNDIRVVALSTVVTQNILVRSELPARSLLDLRGKRLAVLQGTSSHYCLLKVLKENGMREGDLDLVYLAAPEAKVAFETDRIDAWAVWAPFVEQQEVSGKGRTVENGDAVINSVMSVSGPFLRNHEPAARAIAVAVHRAKKWIVEHPEDAQRIAAEELRLEPAVVKQAWPKHNWATALTEAAFPDLQEKANFLAEEDKARARIDVRKDYVDLRFSAGAP